MTRKTYTDTTTTITIAAHAHGGYDCVMLTPGTVTVLDSLAPPVINLASKVAQSIQNQHHMYESYFEQYKLQ